MLKQLLRLTEFFRDRTLELVVGSVWVAEDVVTGCECPRRTRRRGRPRKVEVRSCRTGASWLGGAASAASEAAGGPTSSDNSNGEKEICRVAGQVLVAVGVVCRGLRERLLLVPAQALRQLQIATHPCGDPKTNINLVGFWPPRATITILVLGHL